MDGKYNFAHLIHHLALNSVFKIVLLRTALCNKKQRKSSDNNNSFFVNEYEQQQA